MSREKKKKRKKKTHLIYKIFCAQPLLSHFLCFNEEIKRDFDSAQYGNWETKSNMEKEKPLIKDIIVMIDLLPFCCVLSKRTTGRLISPSPM